MACIEHRCTNPDCPKSNFGIFNNTKEPTACAECLSPMQHIFDEEYDKFEDEDN